MLCSVSSMVFFQEVSSMDRNILGKSLAVMEVIFKEDHSSPLVYVIADGGWVSGSPSWMLTVSLRLTKSKVALLCMVYGFVI